MLYIALMIISFVAAFISGRFEEISARAPLCRGAGEYDMALASKASSDLKVTSLTEGLM